MNFICKKCGTETTAATSVLDPAEYRAYCRMMEHKKLCPECIRWKNSILKRLENFSDREYSETAKNLIALRIVP